ncbi:MAG: tetratricopeptide repeat protein [bacterium]
MTTPIHTSETSRRSRLVGAIALLVLAVAPLLPTLRAAFIYDDTTIIRDNALLRGWSEIGRAWSQPYWPSDGVGGLGLYRPLHIALLATIWNASGGSALWFHLYALALAALTTVAVWWIVRRGVGTAPALVGAAWFATHPLHVEAVASVANTSELIVMLCIAGLVWVIGSTEPTPDNRARDVKRAIAVGLLAGAAISAKESGLLALPLAAVTVWGWRQASTTALPIRDFVRSNARAWAAASVCIIAVFLARLVVLGAPVSHASIAAQGLSALSGPQRVGVMLSLWPRIAGMLAWPTSLSPFYGPSIFPEHTGGLATLSVVVVLSLIGITVALAARGDLRPLVAVGWVALTYFPASNLAAATGQILSDRTLFGATIGVALGIAWALDRLPTFARRVATVLLALAIIRGAVMSAHYAVAWTSHRALWTRLAEVSPTEHLSYKLLGMDARARGDTAQALPLLERAFTMAPADRQIRFELGQVQYTTGRYAAAVRTLAPLLHDGDARSERGFVALYLDAVGRASGPDAVIRAAAPLMHSETAPVAALFLGVAEEQLGHRVAAESAYVAGLRKSAGDSALVARWTALHPEHQHH